MKDWTGNKATTFAQLGASNHSDVERETNDFYATDPNTVDLFIKALQRDGISIHNVWECACGMGHISEKLKEYGYKVFSTDLIDRGYGKGGVNFLETSKALPINVDILTNPPYKYAQEFVEHSLELLANGNYCIMLLKIQFLEGKARRKLFSLTPPIYVYVNSERQMCYLNGDMSERISSASCYCWFIWQKGFKGEPKIRWI